MIKFLIKEICFDVLFGTAVVKILAGKDAKKVYTNYTVTAIQ